MSAPIEEQTLSSECTLARQAGYDDVHDLCRQTKDIPLPYSNGLLLKRRCACICHLGRGE